MQKLKVGAIWGALKQVADIHFLFAPAQQIWLFLVIACDMGLVVLNPAQGDPASYLILLVNLLLLPVVVNTHRFLLLGEAPGKGARLTPAYFLAALGIWLPVVIAAAVTLILITRIAGPMPMNDTAPPNVLFGMLTLVAFTVFLVVMFAVVWPMALALPARALERGHKQFSYRDGMNAAKGNIPQLMLLTAMVIGVYLVIILVGVSLTGLLRGACNRLGLELLGDLFAGGIAGVMDYLAAIAAAAMLSFAYGGLVVRDPRYLTSGAI